MSLSDSWSFADPFTPPILHPDEVHVWRMDIPPPVFWDGITLPGQDRIRAAQLGLTARAVEFRRLRAWLRTLLRGYAGALEGDQDFVFGEHGKPGLPAGDLQFNLSHCRDQCLLALTRKGPVGVDVERVDRQANCHGLALRYFHPDEQVRLSDSDAPPLVFMQIWTAKEALLKARGLGISVPLADLNTGVPLPDLILAPLPVPEAWVATLAHPHCRIRCFQSVPHDAHNRIAASPVIP